MHQKNVPLNHPSLLGPGNWARTNSTHPISHSVWSLVWLISLPMIFERYLRSVFLNTDELHTQIAPGVWLSDVGLLIPILLAISVPRVLSRLFRNPILIGFSLLVAYGIFFGMERNNFFSNITSELRISLALISGLCLGYLLPANPSSLAKVLVGTSFAAVTVAALALINSPSYLLLDLGFAVGDPAFFVVIGLTTCLLAPSIILTVDYGKRRLAVVAWFNLGVSLMIAMTVAITRTLSFSFMATALMAIVSSIVLAYAKTGEARFLRQSIMWLMPLSIIVLMLLFQRNMPTFLARVFDPSAHDQLNWTTRVDEAQSALAGMAETDHLLGQGFGAQTEDPFILGLPTTILHIGVLNIWWRFGLPVFIVFLLLVLRAGLAYLVSLNRAIKLKVDAHTRAVLIAAPGAFTLLFQSLFSGGWATSPMLSLGILWGIYETLDSLDENRLGK